MHSDITAVSYEDSECELQLEAQGTHLQASPSCSAVTASNLKQSILRKRNLVPLLATLYLSRWSEGSGISAFSWLYYWNAIGQVCLLPVQQINLYVSRAQPFNRLAVLHLTEPDLQMLH